MYTVKEAFYTLQGEGARAGRASVFCRFAGCNLWSGREQDRDTSVCRFCDTDFVGTNGQNGGKFRTASELADFLASLWPEHSGIATPYVVFTGGEPLLQLDRELVDAMHARGFEIAVETNGTVTPPAGIDWLCVSPKGASELVLTGGDELKLVYPQPEALPERFVSLDFAHFYLQPLDTAALDALPAPAAAREHYREVLATDTPMNQCVSYCMANPQWQLSLQTHKISGID
ncbi:7-carboxy-7-deazaguanine synthase [Cobetia marina]|jgi:7-carboxy-7-deazaguanine synthase (Cx14CxxC type)|uniref:7-carboxy-7-deazaguanine synthase n=1 Tax=Cobetia marina TaxID=28258 RepID=A0ABU9GHQ7_COBMA|nr:MULTISPECIES: 7-carboxy-7-deazaguanine synthase [Cobetia]MDA5562687.1 7-carboxy-7-deazaguanine synthase [Cobetia sp. MMG027]MDH2373133.1 7-carboxy-7-deazaguanine synthase [Cobetia sp. 3AK]MDI6002641.1 7-carboxy-7-deazaguanine synthase [Cobetia pacifica]POR07313.1 7-carboxy-7-deazaguanine synthase [Cobetia sp. MM1IDA2H-1]TKD62908.1 7-carboxy-7-deazaguanine synthase [Cobetia marina]